MIARRLVAAAWFVWKLVAAVLVILLILFLIGWFVDVVVDPAEQEISFGDELAMRRIGAEDA